MGFLCCCGASAGSHLLEAAKDGDAAATLQLVANNPSVLRKAQQWGGQTAWHIAAKEGHADVLRSMAEAIRAMDPQQLKLLSKYGSAADAIIRTMAGEQDSKMLTPLHLACIKGHAEAAQVLMSHGINPFAMDSVGRTALHYAASWGFADCINAVLSSHSGTPKTEWEVAWPNTEDTPLVDVQNLSGFTPLHYAVWVGRKEAIQALASYDASLKVVNTSNDFDWIKVGTGNTPLHLAAFGGDFDVVRLLLAAHVQTLSAGTEVMTAARGQWGERHADDVRHMRNRRGLMAYHIAMHKHFQHLAELLHPDIPYTFIFSNDDMEVGSVRMFGPARLMVLAAKALQQKLVDELTAVELGKASAPAAAIPCTAAAVSRAAAAPAAAGAAAGEGRQELSLASLAVPGQHVGRRAPEIVISNPNGDLGMVDSRNSTADANVSTRAAGTAAAKNAAAAAGDSGQQQHHDQDSDDDANTVVSPVAELLSPFAARSHKKWTASSMSERTGSSGSVDTIGLDALAAAAPATAPAAAGPATSFISDTTTDPASAYAGVDGAVSFTSAQMAAAAAAAAVGDAGDSPDVTFGGVILDNTASIATDEAVGTVDVPAAVQQNFSFRQAAPEQPGLTTLHQQQQQQQQMPTSVSDASLSSSTVPGSTSAVAGTPAGSVISSIAWAESGSATSPHRSRTSNSSKWLNAGSPSYLSSGNRVDTNPPDRCYIPRDGGTAAGNGLLYHPATAAAAAGGIGGINFVSAPGGTATSSPDASRLGGNRAAAAAAPSARHRRAHSVEGDRRAGSATAAAAAAGSGGHHQPQRQGSTSKTGGRRSTAEWLRPMDSLIRAASRRSFIDEDVLPPSIVITTAADDDDTPTNSGQQQQQHNGGAGSLPGTSRVPTTEDLDQFRQDYVQQQQYGGSTTAAAAPSSSAAAAAREDGLLADNPVDVMLAHRAGNAGDNLDSIRQNLLMLKLASGALNFNTAVSASLVSTETKVSPNTSFTGQRPPPGLRKISGGDRAVTQGVGAAAAAAAAEGGGLYRNQSPERQQQQQRTESPDSQGSVYSSVDGAGPIDRAAAAARQMRRTSSSINRSALGRQPSLHRLLSGSSRHRLSISHRYSGELAAAAAAAAAAQEPAGDLDSAAAAWPAPQQQQGTSTAGSLPSNPPLMLLAAARSQSVSSSTGGLPIIQQQQRNNMLCNSPNGRLGIREESAESDSDDENTCEVCFDAMAIVALQACGHTLCVGCCREMCKLHHFKPALCPYCRQIICGFYRADVAVKP